MRATTFHWSVIVFPCTVALGSIGCADLFEQDAELFVMSQMHQVTNDSEPLAGFMCGNVESGGAGSSGGGDASNDWWEQQSTDSDGLHVVVGSYDEVLEDRFYSTAFIASRQVDRFVVDTRDGQRYSYTVWGGSSCESCPPGPFEPLPGDPWGCGDLGDEALDQPANGDIPGVEQ